MSAALAFLLAPRTHGGAEIEHVETHLSHIVLAGARAYKLKKSVDLGFCDFSTVARREAACRAELEVNRRAGALYLGVTPILRHADGGSSFGDDPPPAGLDVIDWVVVMRRFDRTQEFDRLAAAGLLGRADVEALADRLAEDHAAAEPRPNADGAAAMAATVAQVEGPLGADAGAWAEAARAEIGRCAGHLNRRARRGCVRRCHGDLHLGNIVRLDGAPVPFDALEFDERLAAIDVGYDLAFPIMDLASLGRADLSGALLSRWLSATRDTGALALMPLFVSLRAAIRAMTARLRGDPVRAASRLALAEAGLAPRAAPRLVAIGGLSGAGKSTLARALAPALGPLWGAVHLSSDVARKRRFGVAPEMPLGPDAYAPHVSAAVYAALRAQARRALRSGVSVVVDALQNREADQAEIAALARRLGVRFDGLWLDLAPDTRAARVSARTGDVSDADAAVAAAQAEPTGLAEGWTRLDASGGGEITLAAARSALGLAGDRSA